MFSILSSVFRSSFLRLRRANLPRIHHGLSYARCVVVFSKIFHIVMIHGLSFLVRVAFIHDIQISPRGFQSSLPERLVRPVQFHFARTSRQSTLDFSNDTLNQKVPCISFEGLEKRASETLALLSGFHHVEIRHISYYFSRRPRGGGVCFGEEEFFKISLSYFFWVLFSSSVLSLFIFIPKSSPFSSSKTTTNLRKKSRHKERAALRLAHAVRAEEKEAKQATCRFFVARSRRARDTPRCEYKRRRRRRHTLEQQQL